MRDAPGCDVWPQPQRVLLAPEGDQPSSARDEGNWLPQDACGGHQWNAQLPGRDDVRQGPRDWVWPFEGVPLNPSGLIAQALHNGQDIVGIELPVSYQRARNDLHEAFAAFTRPHCFLGWACTEKLGFA